MTNVLTWVLLLASIAALSEAQEDSSTTHDYSWCPGNVCTHINYNHTICVYDSFKCNGIKQCDDGSDEMTEEECKNFCPNTWCAADKKCLMSYNMCNGRQDCSDGFDEPDLCESICPPDAWCESKKTCISEYLFCDGYEDCSDGIDEPDECDQFCDEMGDHWCGESNGETGNVGRTNACIHFSWVCDDYQDCRDNSDEMDCPLAIDEDTVFAVVTIE